jgi:hypothetical protein
MPHIKDFRDQNPDIRGFEFDGPPLQLSLIERLIFWYSWNWLGQGSSDPEENHEDRCPRRDQK